MSVSDIINLLFFFGVGAYFTLMGFGFARACKTEAEEKIWREKYAMLLKVIGPCLIFTGAATLVIIIL